MSVLREALYKLFHVIKFKLILKFNLQSESKIKIMPDRRDKKRPCQQITLRNDVFRFQNPNSIQAVFIRLYKNICYYRIICFSGSREWFCEWFCRLLSSIFLQTMSFYKWHSRSPNVFKYYCNCFYSWPLD